MTPTGDDPKLLIEQGKQLLEAGKHEQATEVLRQALTLAPADEEAHFYLGVALLEQGQLEPAIQSFEAVTRLKPDAAKAWHNIGYCYYKLGMVDSAVAPLQRAIEIQPTKWDSHFLLGLVYFLQVKLEPAVESLTRALELGGEQVPRADAYDMLACAHEILGQADLAQHYKSLYEQARATRPAQEPRTAPMPPVEHFLYFPTYERAVAAVEALRAEGFRAMLLSEPEDAEESFCVLVEDDTQVDDEHFDEVVARLEQFALRYDGEYDGFGQAI
ncbi:MAG: tetratricopeptide repeat protein [Armatimonadota bacterium]|nr:tetratricopeptide repeat protein [Armatimonadota bacterium]